MKDAIVAEVAQLLHSILGEVRAVKETVGAHESRFDDILFQLKMLQSYDKAPLTTKPRYAQAERRVAAARRIRGMQHVLAGTSYFL